VVFHRFPIVVFSPEAAATLDTTIIRPIPLKTPPHIAPVWYFTPYYSFCAPLGRVRALVSLRVVALRSSSLDRQEQHNPDRGRGYVCAAAGLLTLDANLGIVLMRRRDLLPSCRA